MEQNTVPNHQVYKKKNQFRFIRHMKSLGLFITTHEFWVVEMVKRNSSDLWNLTS